MRAEIVSSNIKREGMVVLTRVILFLVYYVALIIIGFLLLVGAGWVTLSIPDHLSGLERQSQRASATRAKIITKV